MGNSKLSRPRDSEQATQQPVAEPEPQAQASAVPGPVAVPVLGPAPPAGTTAMPMLNQMQQQRPSMRQQQQRPSMRQQQKLPMDGADFNDDDPIEMAAVASSVVAAQPEPDPDVGADGSLSLSTRLEYSALPRGETQDVFSLVTVQAASAPEPDAGETSCEPERQPMDMICVLDVSGSMRGDKISQVQGAMRFIIGQADPKDRISIVAFNQEASKVLRLRRMDAEGKDNATASTLRLRTGGGTSIAAGLDIGLQVLEHRRQRNKVSAILLLTDGQDASTRERLPALLARAAAARCAVYAFGFGSDHDAALLSEIAEQAHTPFTYVEDTENIKGAFAGAVGGLSSIVAQGVEVTISCRVPLKTVHTAFTVHSVSESQATVSIPDMFAGERRDIPLELSVPAGAVGQTVTVLLEASVRYTDLRQGRVVQTVPVTLEAARVDEPQPELEPDEEVTAQRERVEVTRALQEATTQCDQGQLENARHVLDAAESRMKASKKKTKMAESLGQELEDARSRMRSRSIWEQGGRAEVADATQMYKMQRCTNTASSSKSSKQKGSKAMYVNKIQSAWISRSEG